MLYQICGGTGDLMKAEKMVSFCTLRCYLLVPFHTAFPIVPPMPLVAAYMLVLPQTSIWPPLLAAR